MCTYKIIWNIFASLIIFYNNILHIGNSRLYQNKQFYNIPNFKIKLILYLIARNQDYRVILQKILLHCYKLVIQYYSSIFS